MTTRTLSQITPLVVLAVSPSGAMAINSLISGDWNATATWQAGTVTAPADADGQGSVNIRNGDVVDITTPQTTDLGINVTDNGGAGATSTLNIGADLTINPDAVEQGPNDTRIRLGVNSATDVRTANVVQTAGVVLVADAADGDDDVFIGHNQNNVGNWTISGGTLDVGDDILVGNTNTAIGNLIVTGGSVLSGDDINAGVNQSSTGTITISAGTVASGDDLTLGAAADAVGTVVHSGTGVVTTTDDLIVGNNGTGTYQMQGGSFYSDSEIRVGQNAGSTGTISQTGGTVESNSHAFVGVNGTGSYTLAGGELMVGLDGPTAQHPTTPNGQADALNDEQLRIGYNNGSTGTFTQTGGFLQTDDDVIVGRGDMTNATLDIQGGIFTIGDSGTTSDGGENLVVGESYSTSSSTVNEGGATATISVSGGTLNIGDQTGNNSDFNIEEGNVTVNVTGGVVNVEDDWNLSQQNSLAGVTNTGTAMITLSSGIVNVGDNIEDRNGTTIFGVGGLGILNVTDNVNFNNAPGANGVSTFHVIGSSQSLTIGNNLQFANGHILKFEFDAGGFAPITVGNNVDLGDGGAGALGMIDFGAWSPGLMPFGTEVPLIDILGGGTSGNVGAAGLFSNWAVGTTVGQTGPTSWQISNLGGDGNNLVLIAVPEPTRAALLFLGLGALVLRRRH